MTRPALPASVNYHQLRGFWAVARAGGVTAATRLVPVSQPTLSGQLAQLEGAMGVPLFARAGRGLALTEHGRLLLRFAEQVFALERELHDTLGGMPTGRPTRLRIGVADDIPKLLVWQWFDPLLEGAGAPTLVVREGEPDRLLAALDTLDLDVAVLDGDPPAAGRRRHLHPLGASGVSLYAAAPLAARLRRRFPRSLDGAPLLLPARGSALRGALEGWWAREGIRPTIVAEADDSALLKVAAAAGRGMVALPAVLGHEVQRRYGLRLVGAVPGARLRFTAVTVERRLAQPALQALARVARRSLADE